MKICDFTVPELNKFRELCNFTSEEADYFNLKAKDKTNIEIAFAMNCSEAKVSKLARKVKEKNLQNNTIIICERDNWRSKSLDTRSL